MAAEGASATRAHSYEMGLLRHLTQVGLIVLCSLALSVVVHLVLVSALQHRTAQQGAYDKLRKQLALGTAPVAQTDQSGRLLAFGRPVALIDIPSIHVHEVVLEGTTPGVLMSGPGHRRDSPMPGQAGISVIFGRAAAFGGPFRSIHKLHLGAKIIVTTGEGTSAFDVIARRKAGDKTPPPLQTAKGRLQLVTASGPSFMPSGVFRVDADLTTSTLATPPTVLSGNAIPASEQPLGADTTTMWALVLWLEALIVVAVGIVWSWTRWGRHQTWIVFLPMTALIGFLTSDQFIRLLPNLL